MTAIMTRPERHNDQVHVREGHAAPEMIQLIDALLEQHSPKAEPYDPSTPRAMRCQIILTTGEAFAGAFSETGWPGIYRVASPAQKQDRTVTMIEQYIRVESIASLVIERADLADLAKKQISEISAQVPRIMVSK